MAQAHAHEESPERRASGVVFINHYKTNFNTTSQRTLINRHCSEAALKAHRRRKEVAKQSKTSEDFSNVAKESPRRTSTGCYGFEHQTHVTHTAGGKNCEGNCQTSLWPPKNSMYAPSFASTSLTALENLEALPVIPPVRPTPACTNSSRSFDVLIGIRLICSVSLNTIVKEGNSDPFNSFIVQVTPTVNCLVDLSKRCVQPSIGYDLTQPGNQPQRRHGWVPANLFMLSLDQYQSYAVLITLANIALSINPADTTMNAAAMEFKGRACTMLRSKIAQCERKPTKSHDSPFQGSQPMDKMCWSIFLLAHAETSGRHFAEAALHYRMIQKLLLEGATLELSSLHMILWGDTQRAAMSLSRPIIDLEQWVRFNLPSDWRDSSDLDLFGSPAQTPLDKSLDDKGLRQIFTGLRQIQTTASRICSLDLRSIFSSLRSIQAVPKTSGLATKTERDVLVINLSLWRCIYQGKLIELYLGRPDSTSIACLYWLRHYSLHDAFGIGMSSLSKAGSTVFDAGPLILQHLKDCLSTEALSSPSPGSRDDGMTKARLRLWVLYVGSLAERAYCREYSSTEIRAAFLQQAEALGLSTFSDLRDSVLRYFLYDDIKNPQAAAGLETWFDEAMRGNGERINGYAIESC